MDAPAPPAAGDYVSYIKEGDRSYIRSKQYELGFNNKQVNYDLMRLPLASGGLGPDVLDRQRMGAVGTLAGNMKVPIQAPESMFRAQYPNVIDGPVRVIVDQMGEIFLGEVSLQIQVESFVKYYRCGQKKAVNIVTPASPSAMFEALEVYHALDFSNDVIGSNYLDPNHSAPLKITAEDRNQVPGDGLHYWWAIQGDKGALVQAIVLGPELEDYVQCRGRWMQRQNPNVKKGEDPGRLEIGISCHEKEKMPPGRDNKYFNYILFPRQTNQSGIREMVNLLEKPLQTEIRDWP
jgi:hypothetical protein